VESAVAKGLSTSSGIADVCSPTIAPIELGGSETSIFTDAFPDAGATGPAEGFGCSSVTEVNVTAAAGRTLMFESRSRESNAG
jgi:hypothetical protein